MTKTATELTVQFLNTNSGVDLLKKYSIDTVGTWHVRGEDPNCDFSGHHHMPTLGYFTGTLREVIDHAVQLPQFWQWGAGGDITLVAAQPISTPAVTPPPREASRGPTSVKRPAPIKRIHHGLDTDTHVRFYDQEFYVLSNFSSFRVLYNGVDYDTSEHAYHAQKFTAVDNQPARTALFQVMSARSAHAAFKAAEVFKAYERTDWKNVRINVMHDILVAKVEQHEYVMNKLLETGNRLLIENSWRDSFWGEGEDGKGNNRLGKLWMAIRAVLQDGQSLTTWAR